MARQAVAELPLLSFGMQSPCEHNQEHPTEFQVWEGLPVARVLGALSEEDMKLGKIYFTRPSGLKSGQGKHISNGFDN